MFKAFKKNKEKTVDDELFSSLKKDNIQLTKQEIQKAKYGDVHTLYHIAVEYRNKQDYVKELTWYHKAAMNNYAPAQNEIGYMYRYGLGGVDIDYKLAMEWYLKAASNGNSNAQNNIGNLYSKALGVTKDVRLAIEWYTKAATNNQDRLLNAQYNLGWTYEIEMEVRDLQKAVNWYRIAVDNGHEKARKRLERLNRKGYYPNNEEEVEEKELQRTETIVTLPIQLEEEEEGIVIIVEDETGDGTVFTGNSEDYINQLIKEKMKRLKRTFHRRLSLLEQEKAKMETEQLKKDKENQELKETIAQLLATQSLSPKENQRNSYYYDTEDGQDDCRNDIYYDTEDDQDDYRNDIYYDSSDNEDE